jgi:hypothetical protein
MMTRILSNAVFFPKIRMPPNRIRANVIKNMIKALTAICRAVSWSPLPKSSFMSIWIFFIGKLQDLMISSKQSSGLFATSERIYKGNFLKGISVSLWYYPEQSIFPFPNFRSSLLNFKSNISDSNLTTSGQKLRQALVTTLRKLQNNCDDLA